MEKIKMTFAALLLASGVLAAEFTLPQANSVPPYVVTVDRYPTLTGDGVPTLPPGTVMTIRAAKGGEDFKVFLISPLGSTTEAAKGVWSGTFTKPGGYRVQFGRETLELLVPLEFIIGPAPVR